MNEFNGYVVCCDCAACFQGMKGKIDEYSDSDEDQHDAYLERMKAEGKIREEGNDSDESEGSGSGEWLLQGKRNLKNHDERMVLAELELFSSF